jgi:2Fe-2S ferredoxin
MAIPRVTFLPLNTTVEVDDEKYPLADHGKPGRCSTSRSRNEIELEHNCGGAARARRATSSCARAKENLSTMAEDEEDRLDTAEGLTIHSRLGCQAVVRGDVVVEIPSERSAGGTREDIGIALSEKFPDVDPLTVRFTDLHRYVTELPDSATTRKPRTRRSWKRSRWRGWTSSGTSDAATRSPRVRGRRSSRRAARTSVVGHAVDRDARGQRGRRDAAHEATSTSSPAVTARAMTPAASAA